MQAASVNRADLDNLYPRWQFTRLFLGLRRPRVRRLGLDVAGVVEAVGPDVTRFAIGDRVFGDLFAYGQSAFSEYVCAAEKAFDAMPAGLAFEDAAALPHSAILAIQGLRVRSGRTVGPGDKVLIVGASGNVGPFAVQIARSRGAAVTGVASTAKLDFVRSLGADRVIDYTTTDPARTGDRYDWILDADAHLSMLRWRSALRPGGTYVALGGPVGWFLRSAIQSPALRLLTRESMGMMLWWKPFHAPDVETLKAMTDSGSLKPRIDRRFRLDDVVEALRYVDAGSARGKVIVTP
jgi:NADPH:quinone reductase-like Zn-dependent oxidoreductase